MHRLQEVLSEFGYEITVVDLIIEIKEVTKDRDLADFPALHTLLGVAVQVADNAVRIR